MKWKLVEVILIVIGALGTIPKNLRRNLDRLTAAYRCRIVPENWNVDNSQHSTQSDEHTNVAICGTRV